jgi:hypothetical protein
MRCRRHPLLPVFAGLALALTSAPAQQPLAPAQPTKPAKPATPAVKPEPPKPPKADPEATRLFEDALKKVRRLDWVEARLWQQIDMQGLTLQSEGRYLAKSRDQKLHLVLHVNLGQVPATLELFSDGNMMYRTKQIGSEDREVLAKIEIKKVREALNSPTMDAEVRAGVLRDLAMMGVAPLMEAIRRRMVIMHHEKAAWNDRWDERVARSRKTVPEVILLDASWSPEAVKQFLKGTKPGQPWPPDVPRHCHLYLDRATGWPYRVEWWGPVQQRAGDALLFQMEFRNPRLSLADLDIPAERLAKEFDFKPGTTVVKDETTAVIHDAEERNRKAGAGKKQPGARQDGAAVGKR